MSGAKERTAGIECHTIHSSRIGHLSLYDCADDSLCLSGITYECSTEKWTELPSCPYENSGLAIIDSDLTTVGGEDGAGCRTNKLFTLRQGKWVEMYPPINTTMNGRLVYSVPGCNSLIEPNRSDNVLRIAMHSVISKFASKLLFISMTLVRSSFKN